MCCDSDVLFCFMVWYDLVCLIKNTANPFLKGRLQLNFLPIRFVLVGANSEFIDMCIIFFYLLRRFNK